MEGKKFWASLLLPVGSCRESRERKKREREWENEQVRERVRAINKKLSSGHKVAKWQCWGRCLLRGCREMDLDHCWCRKAGYKDVILYLAGSESSYTSPYDCYLSLHVGLCALVNKLVCSLASLCRGNTKILSHYLTKAHSWTRARKKTIFPGMSFTLHSLVLFAISFFWFFLSQP